jgi:hypothetical protein
VNSVGYSLKSNAEPDWISVLGESDATDFPFAVEFTVVILVR